MDPLAFNAVPPPQSNVFSRMKFAFKSMSLRGKVVTVSLLALLVYGASLNSSKSAPRPMPAPYNEGGNRPDPYNQHGGNRPTAYNPGNSGTTSGGQSQEEAQLMAEHQKLSAWAQQCMQQMNAVAAQNAQRAMNGQMPIQAPCTNTMYQVTAQMAAIEAQLKQLHGQRGGVCELTGYCPPSGGGSGNGSSGHSTPNDGTEAVERTSREGTLGQCIYRSDDGYERQLPCDGGNTYWENTRHGGFTAGAYAPNDGSDYRRYTYSSH